MNEQMFPPGAGRSPAPGKRRRRGGPAAPALVALAALALALSGCAKPELKVGPQSPPTFRLSGGNRVIFFHVADKSGPIWKVLPQGGDLTLDEISSVTYGRVPACCRQVIPSDAASPPALVEGETYYAVASVFDSDVVRVSFTIKDGQVVELPAAR
jgi:hypothetical protein